jgi:hypothetical protein
VFKRIAVVIVGAGLLAACNEQPDPYISKTDTRGTPADRTGGAAAPAPANSGSAATPAPSR